MNGAVIAALITTVGALLSTLLFIFKDHLAGVFRRPLRRWEGPWRGTGHSKDTDTTYIITLTLKQKGRVLSGTLTTHSPEILEYQIKGRIHEPEFMTFFAENTDRDTVNYLVGLVRWERGASRMIGMYVARSRLVEGISTGYVELYPRSLDLSDDNLEIIGK